MIRMSRGRSSVIVVVGENKARSTGGTDVLKVVATSSFTVRV